MAGGLALGLAVGAPACEPVHELEVRGLREEPAQPNFLVTRGGLGCRGGRAVAIASISVTRASDQALLWDVVGDPRVFPDGLDYGRVPEGWRVIWPAAELEVGVEYLAKTSHAHAFFVPKGGPGAKLDRGR